MSILPQEVSVRNVELLSHHQMEELRKGQKETPPVLPPPRILLADILSCLSNGYATRKDSFLRMIGQKLISSTQNLTASHIAETSSWVPSPSCSLPRCPFPIKYLALSAYVPPWTIHFQVLDKSPLSGSGRGPPSCNNMMILKGFTTAI